MNQMPRLFRSLARGLALLVCSALMIGLLAGCGREEAIDPDRPLVYTSFFPIQSLVSSVVGEKAQVKSLMPIDKDPHLWEPSPKDIQRLSKAKLFVVNGANLERWLPAVREALPDLEILDLSNSIQLITYRGEAAIGDFQYMASQQAKANQKYEIEFGHTHESVMRVAFLERKPNETVDSLIERGKKALSDKKIPLIPQKGTIEVTSDQAYALEMGHESGAIYYQFPTSGEWIFLSDRISEPLLPYGFVDPDTQEPLEVEKLRDESTSGLDRITYDPHSWLSLVNAKSYLNAIQDWFIAHDPENEAYYHKNKLKLVSDLTRLQYDFIEELKPVLSREFMVLHYAYEYLARDFGLLQYPLQGLTSMEAPSLKTLRKAVEHANHVGVRTIFYEQGLESKGADTLALEIGGKAEGLASMEYITQQLIESEKEGEQLDYYTIMKHNLEKILAALKEADQNLSPEYRKILEKERKDEKAK